MAQIRTVSILIIGIALGLAGFAAIAQDLEPSDRPGREVVVDEDGLLVDPGSRMTKPSPKQLAVMEQQLDDIHASLDSRMARMKGSLTNTERDMLIEDLQADFKEHLALLESLELVEETVWTLADIEEKQAAIAARMKEIVLAESPELKSELIADQAEDMDLQVIMMDSWISQQSAE